jgi:ribosomal protein S6
MQKEQMPATEANSEPNSYELAFHVLPTVAEGEVASVVEKIKSHITKAGGNITGEETPARFELAYEIEKHLEGRNRKFSSAYFGWIRFTVESSAVETLTKEIEAMKEILRSIVIKLTKVEEAHPFMFHESVTSNKMHTIEIDEVDSVSEDSDNLSEVTEEETETNQEADGEDE